MGTNVGTGVGSNVGPIVGKKVGGGVGTFVGAAVASGVGFKDGNGVGFCVQNPQVTAQFKFAGTFLHRDTVFLALIQAQVLV